ncbi:ATP-binding protein [Lutibacter sp.]|uniref:ATP-binding protein n=1 Tax=Lutibacter sp. TaxID=1925666 RepID=UPI0025BCC86D|nr:ATP-binding protein [Lutibacter sp.]MCF6182095.1 ATP-binding protein [Lutibacter sp.]
MHQRFLYKELKENLNKKHIALIIGPRQVGKTTLMLQLYKWLKQQSKKTFFLSLEDKDIKNAFNEHPEQLFNFIPPNSEHERTVVFIDEIQYLEDPSNFLKYIFDKYQSTIKLVVSGSSSFYIDKKFKDSLAGRKRVFKLLSLSFPEFVSFRNRGEMIAYINSGSLPKIYKSELDKLMHEYLLYGSYPELVLETSIKNKKDILKELATSYIKKDIIDSNIKSPELYYQILQLLSNQTTSLFNTNSISKTFKKSNQTIELYTYTMFKSFQISKITPFYSNFNKEIRKMPKIYFTDLGLRNYFAQNFEPIALRKDKGELFENFVYRRFSDKYEDLDIQFWLTQKKHEIDFIIKKQKAFEVKFSEKQFNKEKYQYFVKKYPNIKLNLIHFNNVNEIIL